MEAAAAASASASYDPAVPARARQIRAQFNVSHLSPAKSSASGSREGALARHSTEGRARMQWNAKFGLRMEAWEAAYGVSTLLERLDPTGQATVIAQSVEAMVPGLKVQVAELARGFAAQAQRIDSLVSDNATLKRRLSASGREWKKVRKAAGMSGAVVKSADEWVTTTTVRISERRVRELVLEISRKIGNATNGELTDAAKVNLVEALFEHPTFRPVLEAVYAPTSTAKVDRVKGALVRLKAHLGVHEGVAYEALLIAFSPSDSESVNSFANRPGVRLHHLYEHLLHFQLTRKIISDVRCCHFCNS
tara:strand:+ start:366 stop:1286 length:921 start_codon:yes stop_codon:yes gene_type:complete